MQTRERAMTRGVGGQFPAHVETYLKGINYPARKEVLLQKARANGAPGEVMDLLQKLPVEQPVRQGPAF
jgi:hypothetical protein